MEVLRSEDKEETKSSRFSLVNFVPSDESNLEEEEEEDEEEDPTYEILLLPDKPTSIRNTTTTVGSQSSTSICTTGSSVSGLKKSTSNDLIKSGGSNQNSVKRFERNNGNKRRSSIANLLLGDVSPTRTALSVIQDFVETTIVLRKENNELGISITGGSDTYLESICVTEVYTDGAAYKDGRIRKGDLILAVNDISFRDISWKDAVRVLREASSPLKLLVLRENPQILFTTSHRPTKFITVELKKQSIKDKLGLSFMQRTNGIGVFITFVPGSIASAHGKRIRQGDQILEVNGQNVRESNQKDVAALLNSLDGEIVLLLGRVTTLHNNIQEWCRKKSQIHWRTRTSTWSAYGGNNKEKVQNQRPSLPIGKETPYFEAAPSTADKESAPSSPFSFMVTGKSNWDFNEDASGGGMFSRTSSTRSRTRLSIVVEHTKSARESVDSEDGEMTKNGTDNKLLPSIEVTEF